jgi:hypothetical protein
MKNSIPKGDAKGLGAALDALSLLDPQELNARWKALYGSDPPDRLRRPLMIQALAYRLQEQALGGLKPATRRLLANVAGCGETRRPVATDSQRPVKAGAVLIREWHGTKHQVTALKDGFMFRGKRFQWKCYNFENGDGGGPERNWAARSQAGRSNSWSMN